MGRLKDICFDCRDPWTLGHWWADVLGYRVRPHTAADLEQLHGEGIERPEDDPNIAVDPVDAPGPTFWFCRVPAGDPNLLHGSTAGVGWSAVLCNKFGGPGTRFGGVRAHPVAEHVGPPMAERPRIAAVEADVLQPSHAVSMRAAPGVAP